MSRSTRVPEDDDPRLLAAQVCGPSIGVRRMDAETERTLKHVRDQFCFLADGPVKDDDQGDDQ